VTSCWLSHYSTDLSLSFSQFKNSLSKCFQTSKHLSKNFSKSREWKRTQRSQRNFNPYNSRLSQVKSSSYHLRTLVVSSEDHYNNLSYKQGQWRTSLKAKCFKSCKSKIYKSRNVTTGQLSSPPTTSETNVCSKSRASWSASLNKNSPIPFHCKPKSANFQKKPVLICWINLHSLLPQKLWQKSLCFRSSSWLSLRTRSFPSPRRQPTSICTWTESLGMQSSWDSFRASCSRCSNVAASSLVRKVRK